MKTKEILTNWLGWSWTVLNCVAVVWLIVLIYCRTTEHIKAMENLKIENKWLMKTLKDVYKK